MKSIRVNTFYNLLKTTLSLVFPLISFAYTSRILEADGLGKIQFSQSIITYFTLIAMLGIKNYGTREGAKRRENKEQLSQFTCLTCCFLCRCWWFQSFMIIRVCC